MTLQFFWSRTASVWIALLYMALGIPLLLFPGLSGSVFVWALAGGAAVYGISHLWRYLQARKSGQASGGDLFLTVLPLAFSIFAIAWPQDILAFLPLVLGSLLLVDGVGKLPLVLAATHSRNSVFLPLLLSSLIPLVLGLLLVINPFHAAQIVIMVFGAALLADGISDLTTALLSRKSDAGGKAPD